MKSRLIDFSEKGIIIVLLVVTLLKGLLWSTVVPIWQAPDEPAHFAAVQFIAEQGRLPDRADRYMSDEMRLAMNAMEADNLAHHAEIQQHFSNTMIGPDEESVASIPVKRRTTYEEKSPGWGNYFPPFYYVWGALVYRIFEQSDLFTRFYVVRYMSVVLTVAVVWASWQVARVLWPNDSRMRITIPILVSFQPMLTFMGSVVDTDILLVLTFTLLIYWGLQVLKQGLNARFAIAIGVTLGIGMLTKPIIDGMLPALGIALLSDLWQRRGQWKTILGWWLLIGLLAALISGWWLIRSTLLNGNPFYESTMGLLGLSPRPLPDYNLLDHIRVYLTSHLAWFFVTYWAVFGWADTPLQPALIQLLRLVMLVPLVGLGWIAIRVIMRRRQQTFDLVRTGYVATAAWTLLPLYAMIEYSFIRANGTDPALQGRHFLGPVSLHMGLLAMGALVFVPERWRAQGHWALRAAMMAFNLFCLLAVVIPRYFL